MEKERICWLFTLGAYSMQAGGVNSVEPTFEHSEANAVSILRVRRCSRDSRLLRRQ